MGQTSRIVIAALIAPWIMAGVLAAPALAQADPPGRVARLAFTEGAVSFHDDEQSDWTQALVNTPLTSGDSIWTEAGARSEVSLAGTRVRLDGGTQLDLLQVDDTQTKLQLAQGRLDIKTFTLDTNTPYQIVTPRGTITLNQQGDYYVQAGSTQDATRIGVRSGAASFQGVNGQTLAIRANEVGEVTGDSATPQLRTLNTAPPAMPASWATRDRTVVYDAPQYVNAGMTGYEDLNSNGTWSNDPEYGQVWTPRSVPAGWEPYRTGRWQYVKPWGWTWVDEQPWGFAPYHYGRWANRNNRWSWVPPQRETRPVYAPALVAFIGGIELSVSLGQQSRAPVGWFPLAPREAYVPPYTTDRTYYNNVNRSNRIQEAMLEDRWQNAQRRDAGPGRPGQQRFVPANQRYATVVPSEDFVRSRPVGRSLIQVAIDKLTAAPVARVSAPPAPTQSVNAAQPPATPPAAATPPGTRPGATAPAPNTPPNNAGRGSNDQRPDGQRPNGQRPNEPRPADPKAEAEAKAKAEAAAKNVPAAQAEVGGMAVLGKSTAPERPKAPGPKVASRPPAAAAGTPNTPANHPALQPRVGSAPPVLKDDMAPAAPAKPGQPQSNAPAPVDTKPGTPPAPPQTRSEPRQPQANAPTPAEPKPATPPAPPQTRPEPPKPGQTEAKPPAPAPQAQPATPAAKPEPPKPAQTEAKPPAPAAAPPAPVATPQAQPPAPPAAANPREGRRPDAPRTEPSRAEPQRPAETHTPSPPPQAAPATPPPARQAAPAAPAHPPEATPQQAAPPPAAAPAHVTPPKREEPNEGQRQGRDENRRGG